MRLVSFLFLGILLASCVNKNQAGLSDSIRFAQHNDSIYSAQLGDSAQKQLNLSSIDTSRASLDSVWRAEIIACAMLYDTITPNGNFVRHFADEEDNIYVVWGSNSTGIIDTIIDEFSLLGNNCATYYGENNQYLLLFQYGKGLPNAWLLPLNPNDTVLKFYGVISIDTRQNLVLTDEDGVDKFTIENFVSHRKKTLSIGFVPRITYSIPRFDSIAFIKDGVYLEWTGDDDVLRSITQKL